MIHSHAFLQMHSFKTKSKQADASYSLLPLLCLKYTPLNYSWIRVTTKFISTWVKIDSSKIECVLRRFIFNFAWCRHTFHLFLFFFFFLTFLFSVLQGEYVSDPLPANERIQQSFALLSFHPPTKKMNERVLFLLASSSC